MSMIDVIWIQDGNGGELPWKVEKELPNMFEVFHGFLVTHIDKRLVLRDNKDGKDVWRYAKALSIPCDPNKPVRNYFVWGT
jgi:hypothetical protein